MYCGTLAEAAVTALGTERNAEEYAFEPIFARVAAPGTTPKGGETMPIGHERTKEQLYREAKRLRIKGRSRMNKGQLKAALTRHGH